MPIKKIDLKKNNFKIILMQANEFTTLPEQEKMLVARNYMRQLISENNKDINHILSIIAKQSNMKDAKFGYPKMMSEFGKLFLFCGSNDMDHLYDVLESVNVNSTSPKKMVDYMDLYTLYCFNEVQKHFVYILSQTNFASFKDFKSVSQFLLTNVFPRFTNKLSRDEFTDNNLSYTKFPGKYNALDFDLPKIRESDNYITNYDKVFFKSEKLSYDSTSIEGNKVIIKNVSDTRNKLKENRTDDFDYTKPIVTISPVEKHIQMYIKSYMAKLITEDMQLPKRQRVQPYEVLIDFYPQDISYAMKRQQYFDFCVQSNPYYKDEKQSQAQKERYKRERELEEAEQKSILQYHGKDYYLDHSGRFITSEEEFPLDRWVSHPYDEVFTYHGTKDIYLGDIKIGQLNHDGEYEYTDYYTVEDEYEEK